AGSDYVFRVRFDLAKDTAWHPVGIPISWDEFALPWGTRSTPSPAAAEGKAVAAEADGTITLSAGKSQATIDRATGRLSSWKHDGRELLLSPLRLNFWRPPTNNDEGARFPRELAVWRRAGENAVATSVEVVEDGQDVLVTSNLSIPAGESAATIGWRMHPSGQISVTVEFAPKGRLPVLPRVGMQCALPAAIETLNWYGKGPHENYADRKSGAWTAIHTATRQQVFHRFLDPQEAGNRTEIRWARFLPAANGDGLRVDATGDSLLSVSIYPVSQDDIELARHPSDMRRGDR